MTCTHFSPFSKRVSTLLIGSLAFLPVEISAKQVGISSTPTPVYPRTQGKKIAKVVIYCSTNCRYCESAKKLLDDKKVPYEVINITWKKEEVDKLEKKTGKRSVPQILINGKHIGGYLSLVSMESSGELDKELALDGPQAPSSTPVSNP